MTELAEPAAILLMPMMITLYYELLLMSRHRAVADERDS